MRLRFRVLNESKPGKVEIVEALVSDGLDRIDRLVGVRLAEVRALPADYSISQNFPNPFNPETRILYQLPEGGEVSLVIYNALGQEVRALVRERQEAGYYRVVWDGKDGGGRSVSSGVYLYRFVSDGLVENRRMLLLK